MIPSVLGAAEITVHSSRQRFFGPAIAEGFSNLGGGLGMRLITGFVKRVLWFACVPKVRNVNRYLILILVLKRPWAVMIISLHTEYRRQYFRLRNK